MGDELEVRKSSLIKFFKEKKNYLVYLALAIIIWISYNIRTKNLGVLKDITTGKFIPLALDPFAFLRYVTHISENGTLFAVDTLRYYPLGFPNMAEFKLLSYFIAYLHKFINFFNPSITIEQAHILYPPITLGIGLIFFFLLVRKLFNYKIALLSTLFLTVLPAFLYRTMAGFSDKEAFGTMLMFAAFYFYVSSWKSKKLKKGVFLGILAGISTGAMGLVWGGVNFVFLIMGIFALTEIFLDKFTKRDLIIYFVWLISAEILLFMYYPTRFNPVSFLTSLTTGTANLALFVGLVKNFIIDKNSKIKRLLFRNKKLPPGIASFIITFILGLILIIFSFGPSFIIKKISELFISLTEPFGTSRWSLTVAESHQPYLTDWVSQFNGWFYLLAFIIGSIILFHQISKKFSKKDSWKLTTIYTSFIFAFTFSRYSSSSLLNGETSISQSLYIGSLVLFVLFFLYYYLNLFYKRGSEFENISKINKKYIFVLIWFIMMVIAARSAIRLLFIFAPITAVIFSYFSFKVFNLHKKIKDTLIKTGIIIAIILFVSWTFIGFWQITNAQAVSTGPSYNQQWQVAGQWIRENTQEDAVFAHWWDYGYWVQYGGQRATLSDGGNARGAINHFIGRHVLTAHDEIEALELLKANEATHLLMISDEIGKYPAFSSIGADENYDRYSWIPTFGLDPNIQERRDDFLLVYQGGTSLDEDIIHNGKLFPEGAAGLGGFTVPFQNIEINNETQQRFNQPSAYLIYNGEQQEIPLKCSFFQGQEITFEGDGLDACLMIIPSINNNNQVNPLGASLYLSQRVKKTLFTDLYLFGKYSEYFTEVYSDESGMPLAIYNGRIIGPLKIWEISYPNDLDIPEEYYGTKLPNPNVQLVR
ncbi:glycosyltransferase family 39 protein [archaeon]|nr:glycosyltransferase family 39 protein [archaeon]